MQKELAKDIPKVRAMLTAFARITTEDRASAPPVETVYPRLQMECL